MRTRKLLAGCVLALAAAASQAQVVAPPQNVLNLQAQGTLEVQQDLLQMVLTTSRDGPDPLAVQNQLRTALDAALTEAKRAAQPGQLDVRTGNFALYPRYGADGRIVNWAGSAELVLEGRDFPRITQAAGRIQSMTLGGISFGLSREQRARVERDAQAIAIENFKTKASQLASGFGFAGYTLREVSVNASEPGFTPQLRMAAEARKATAMAPVPVEPGKSTVTVNVSGSVQLR